jgi:hypothetical protein
MCRALLFASVLGVLATPIAAQRSPTAFEQWEVAPAPPEQLERFTPSAGHWADTPARDYRYEGLAIGGLVFGTLGAILGSKVSVACPTEPGIQCNPKRLERAVTLGLVSGAFGAALGYAVGRVSPKPNTSQP